jgi:spermidine synthase
VTVSLNGRSFSILSNGLPQSGRSMDPPYYNLESSLVGLFPAIHRPDAANALVVGLGAGITAGVLQKAGVPDVEVIELEPSMASICRSIYPPGQSPLDEPGMTLRLDDARNFMVRNLYRKDSKRWDIIASQPAHPWVSGAADLFTEDMFRLAYRNLADGGVFCQWFMPGSLDEEVLVAMFNAFGRVFDRVIIYRTSNSSNGFYFIGSKGDARIDLAATEKLFARPALRQLLTLNEHPRPVDVLRYAATAPVAGSALVRPGPVNRDANAFIETRMPLLPKSRSASLGLMGGPIFTGLMPENFTAAGQRESLFVLLAIDALSGNLNVSEKNVDPDSLRIGRMVLFAKTAPPPFRDYYRLHLALARGALPPDTLDAISRRASSRLMKYQLRYLLLRKWPAFKGPEAPEPDFDSLPGEFRSDLGSQWMMADAESGRFGAAEALAARVRVDSSMLHAARLLRAHADGDARLLALGDAEFRALYGRCLTEWAQRAGYLSALQWYCEATGRGDRARAVKGALAARENQEVEKLAIKANAYKAEKNFRAAILAYDKALKLNPTYFNAYLGTAECYGSMGLAPEFAALLQKAREIFPVEDIYAFRLKEAFDLAGRSVR